MLIKEREPHTFEICFRDTFDIDNERLFRDMMKEALSKRPTNIFINLSDIEYIDSTALGLLILYKQRANLQNCAITLMEPQNEHVKDVLNMVRIDEMFPVKQAN